MPPAKKILIVDDEAMIRKAVHLALEKEGYEVVEAETGGEALRRIELSKPDLILLDIMLPDVSGFDVCRDIRKAGLRVPIIILSAKTEEIVVVVGLEIGADDYITKPFPTRELPALVDGLFLLARLAQVSGDAGEQLAGAEGLRDVVFGADLQSDDDVDLLRLCAEDDDRHAKPRLADVPADIEPRDVGQHDVEQDQVRLAQLDPAERLAAGLRLDHFVALLLEGEMDRLADHRFVVDDEDLLCGWHRLRCADGNARARSGGGLGTGQDDGEHGAFPVAAAHVDLAAEHRHQTAHDVQPQSGARGAAHDGVVGTVELLEQPGHVLLADSDPLV